MSAKAAVAGFLVNQLGYAFTIAVGIWLAKVLFGVGS